MAVSSSPPLHQDQPNLIESAFLACASSPTRLQADDQERESERSSSLQLQLPLFRLKRALAFIVGETLVTDDLLLHVVLRFFGEVKGFALSEEDFYHLFGLTDEYLTMMSMTSTRPPSQERWREVAEAESGQRDPRKDAAVVHVGREDWSRKPSSSSKHNKKGAHSTDTERREESDKQLELRKPEVGSVFSPTSPKQLQPLWKPSPGLWQPLWLEKDRWFADRGRGALSHSFAQTSLKKYNRAVDLHTEGVKEMEKEKEDQMNQQKEEGAKARFLLSDRRGSPADANIVEKSSPAEDADASILDRLFSDHSTGFEHVGREKAEEGGRRRMLMGDLQRAMVELMGEGMATGQLVQELFERLNGRDARSRGRARNRISAEEEVKTSASNAKNAGGEGGLTQRQFRRFFDAFEEITAGA